MVLKLYTYPGNYRVFKALIAAEFNGINIELPEFDFAKDIKSEEFKAKSPTGKVPLLETDEGCIFESGAIAKYVARLRADTGLYGKSFFESGQVDAWIDFSAYELEIPLEVWLYPILGWSKLNAAALTKAKSDVKKALQTLENHLHLRTYLVGEQITLADIFIASALVYPFKFVLDKDFRKPYPALNRWFSTLVNQPEFQAVVGDVPLIDVALTTEEDNSNTKVVKKEASQNEKASLKEEDVKPKKVEHPLAVLNREKPSSMILDAWKVQYSNTKNLADAMTWFWEHLDTEGYSLWFCDYNYNNENTKMFMTCNAVGGFLQRSEAMRKYAFGVMDVCGAEGSEIIITGCWLFRGDSEKHMIEANPDAEYYTWTKAELNDETKARVAAYWCNEDELEGKPIADSKVFK
ncbi:elongation factor 1 [Plasmopara halstedii]|uniref:Elongation factor 1 n=1 Tax=Plasmopara halstedii TaxID=4781 RepID=A0A0P1AUG2_PLAHL|nr:elongation factor 1 [Plasmopara halstedii]CEG45580.1 elongation factor 1 [Plasmopara halstedii]|eukprot:XP_024581949.1 elongation factor 1 [Plasmopara halstedii]